MPTSTQHRDLSGPGTASDRTCCGARPQVIELRGGEEPLRMLRCSTCASREWHLGTEQVQVDAAFEVLASTYRSAPRQARAARDRAATRTSARAAARARAAALTAHATSCATAPPTEPGARTVDRAGLADLLAGWSVLGATA